MIEQFRSRVGELTAGFTGAQKGLMGLVFVSVVGGLWLFSSWASTTDFAPLYTDLETADASSIVDELDSMGVTYELADQGRTVMVPRAEVYELRLDLSSAGVASGGAKGYALLDDQGITSTQFQQRIAFQRALEGELAATIRSIELIDSASVHLVIPRDDLFTGDDIQSTASVLVHTGSAIGPEQVQAIINLVAGSVEGLSTEAITVADQNGFVLAAPGQTPFDRTGTGSTTNRTRTFEEGIAGDIQAMLAAVVGPGNVMVTVSADLDWDESSTVEEVHTPSVVAAGSDPLVGSESLTAEEYTTSSNGGDRGTLGGDVEQTAATAESTYASEESSRDYVYDSQVTTSENIGGDVKRLNVAVLLDEASITEAQVAEVQTLVTSAAGIDLTRGDTLAVSRLAFDTTISDALSLDAEGAASASAAPLSGGMIRSAVLGLLGLLIVIMAGVQFWRGQLDSEEVEELDLVTLTNSLTAGASRPTLAMSPPPVTTNRAAPAADETLSADDELQMLVDQQPDEVARLLRTWLADRRAVAR